ncbi:MAG: glycerol-3-phosphate acyltransferase [Dehalococcoidia bacterium]
MGFFVRVLLFYRVWVAGVAGYLLGCILSADIVTRMANARRHDAVDLRAVGSGNPGGANAVANLGAGWGAAVVAGDIAKGAIAAQAGRLIAGDAGAYAAATGAVAGHCLPAFANFRGGKGVATSAGTTLICFPIYVPVDLGIVGASYARLRHGAAATLTATFVFCLAAVGWYRLRLPNAWGPRASIGLPLYALATSSVIAWKFLNAPPHKGDIQAQPAHEAASK